MGKLIRVVFDRTTNTDGRVASKSVVVIKDLVNYYLRFSWSDPDFAVSKGQVEVNTADIRILEWLNDDLRLSCVKGRSSVEYILPFALQDVMECLTSECFE